jgi:hypothetical protein
MLHAFCMSQLESEEETLSEFVNSPDYLYYLYQPPGDNLLLTKLGVVAKRCHSHALDHFESHKWLLMALHRYVVAPLQNGQH